MLKMIVVLLASAAAMASAPTMAATITFGGAQQGPLTTYTEAGFTVSLVAGDISTGVGTGNPPPSLFGFNGGLFSVTNGGLFTFSSFAGGSGALTSETQTFNVIGYVGNATIFNSAFTRTGANGFQTFSSNSAAAIDRLVFNLSATNGTSYNVDNIVVNAATAGVPEPSTWAIMMMGFGGMGYAMRRKNKVSTRIRFA